MKYMKKKQLQKIQALNAHITELNQFIFDMGAALGTDMKYKRLWETQCETLLEREITISELGQEIGGLQRFKRLWETLKEKTDRLELIGLHPAQIIKIMEEMEHEKNQL